MYEGIEEIYDEIHQDKDYKKESCIILDIIKKHLNEKNIQLLDVGCGTGQHLVNLSKYFDCVGIDSNEKFIKIAGSKGLKVFHKNMLNFNLDKKFDIIICLFGVIAHALSYENLKKVLFNFKKHLNKDGIIIIEPWLFKGQYRVQRASREISKKIFVTSDNSLENDIAILKKQYNVNNKKYETCIENYCFEKSSFISAIEECGLKIDEFEQKLETDYPNKLFLLKHA